MTTVEAVTDVLEAWKPGVELHGYEIHELVLGQQRAHGETKRPLDATVLRRVREREQRYHIRTVHPDRSLYVKEARA